MVQNLNSEKEILTILAGIKNNLFIDKCITPENLHYWCDFLSQLFIRIKILDLKNPLILDGIMKNYQKMLETMLFFLDFEFGVNSIYSELNYVILCVFQNLLGALDSQQQIEKFLAISQKEEKKIYFLRLLEIVKKSLTLQTKNPEFVKTGLKTFKFCLERLQFAFEKEKNGNPLQIDFEFNENLFQMIADLQKFKDLETSQMVCHEFY